MQTRGAGDRTTDILIGRRPALPTEPQLPLLVVLSQEEGPHVNDVFTSCNKQMPLTLPLNFCPDEALSRRV